MKKNHFVSYFQWCDPLTLSAVTWQTVCSPLIGFQSVFGVYFVEMYIGTLFLGYISVDDMVLLDSVEEMISCTNRWSTLWAAI